MAGRPGICVLGRGCDFFQFSHGGEVVIAVQEASGYILRTMNTSKMLLLWPLHQKPRTHSDYLLQSQEAHHLGGSKGLPLPLPLWWQLTVEQILASSAISSPPNDKHCECRPHKQAHSCLFYILISVAWQGFSEVMICGNQLTRNSFLIWVSACLISFLFGIPVRTLVTICMQCLTKVGHSDFPTPFFLYFLD